MKSNKEIWRDVPKYEGYYQASDQGRVKSLWFGKEKIMKKTKANTGYMVVNLSKDGKRKTFNVHQLVAMAFLDHKPNEDGLVVDHINNIKTNNMLCNLQLVSQRHNSSKDQWRNNPSSKYAGVSWVETRQKWRARIQINKKNKSLGSFDTEIEGHNAYQNALKNL